MLLFSPDLGILILSVSALLIFLELNRPGLVLPGALGLLGLLLAVNSFRQWPLNTTALLVLSLGLALSALQLRYKIPAAWAVPSATGCVFGFARLVGSSAPAQVHLLIALPCGLVVGIGASLLARIALRARRNKGLN